MSFYYSFIILVVLIYIAMCITAVGKLAEYAMDRNWGFFWYLVSALTVFWLFGVGVPTFLYESGVFS